MRQLQLKTIAAAICLASLGTTASAQTASVSLTRLSGLTGVNGTAVFRGDLSAISLAEIQSITLFDSNSMIGGSPGAFSGFDLDAIKLSTTNASTAAQASAAVGIDAFDFTPVGTHFTQGTQRPPAAPKLFGTDASGLNVDAPFATLNTFDAQWFVSGAVSLGDGGRISFDLKSPVSTSGLFIYVGEVSGSSGEGIAGGVLVSSPVPEPASWAFMLAGIGLVSGLLAQRRSGRTAQA